MRIKLYLTLCLISLMLVVNIARANVYILKDNKEQNNVLTCPTLFYFQKRITELRIAGVDRKDLYKKLDNSYFTDEFIITIVNEIEFIYMLPKPMDPYKLNAMCGSPLSIRSRI